MNLLSSLRYLVALQEHKHFGRAAEACHITQPALSNALRAMEEHFGVGIVRRGRQYEGLTPEGEQVEVVLRLNETQRESVDQIRQLPVAYARDGTAISLDSVATIETVFNPEVIRRQNLQRREAVFAGVQEIGRAHV